MNEAIKLAVDKGHYDILKYYPAFHKLPEHKIRVILRANMERMQLDPLFWKALGKALGWNTISVGGETVWKYHWHRFINSIAEGKDVDEFFQNLLK